MGGINFFAGLELDIANLEDVFRAFVKKPHDLRVELVDGFAMLGNVHGAVEPEIRFASGTSASGFGSAKAASNSFSTNCSGGAVANPGSAVSNSSGFLTTIF